MRRVNALGPMMPSVIAAIPGAKIELATPASDWVIATGRKPGAIGRTRQQAVTRNAAMTIAARL